LAQKKGPKLRDEKRKKTGLEKNWNRTWEKNTSGNVQATAEGLGGDDWRQKREDPECGNKTPTLRKCRIKRRRTEGRGSIVPVKHGINDTGGGEKGGMVDLKEYKGWLEKGGGGKKRGGTGSGQH